MASNRINRIEEEIKRALAHIIQTEVNDDRMSRMVSVTRAEVTPDLRYSKIYISVYDDKNVSGSIDALNHGASFLRTRLAHKLDLRRVPELKFILDNSSEYSMKISKLLYEVHAKDDV